MSAQLCGPPIPPIAAVRVQKRRRRSSRNKQLLIVLAPCQGGSDSAVQCGQHVQNCAQTTKAMCSLACHAYSSPLVQAERTDVHKTPNVALPVFGAAVLVASASDADSPCSAKAANTGSIPEGGIRPALRKLLGEGPGCCQHPYVALTMARLVEWERSLSITSDECCLAGPLLCRSAAHLGLMG